MSDFARKLAQTKEAVAALRSDAGFVRMFFEPRPCADPEAFARQCAAEADGAQAVIVRFVKPSDLNREGALQ